MTPRIEWLESKILAGFARMMTFDQHQPALLWQQLMPRISGFTGRRGKQLYSAEVYENGYFSRPFDPKTPFEKWAAVEFSSAENIPEDLKILIIPAGKYALFTFQGDTAGAGGFYANIYRQWLPENGLIVDDRPHFAVMDEQYNRHSPDSSEEIWIPVK